MTKCWFKDGNRIGVFLAILFIVCFAWYWLHPIQQELHVQLLELLFYGYSGMNFPSLALGVIQSYVWGYIFVALWYLSCRCCGCKKCEGS